MNSSSHSAIDRRKFLRGTIAGATAIASTRKSQAAGTADLKPIHAEIVKRHDEAVRRLQDWIHQPTIAAENRGMTEGCDLMLRLVRDAGFDRAEKISTDGHPGVFATLDAGAARTVGLYFMYDVKQVDPAEWSSPPLDGALVDKPGLGKVLIGRGAVNQKGPQAAFLAALHAFRRAGRKLPVNLVFVAESEEEIGSPHFPQIVHRPEVLAALRKCSGIFMPNASQALDGTVTTSLGAKGVIEVELVSSGDRWRRGPKLDIHSSNEARVDSPAWHLVQALATLVAADGHTPALTDLQTSSTDLAGREGHDPRGRAAPERSGDQETTRRRTLGPRRRLAGGSRALVSRPTVNIEGLVGGYTGPGGKTILPHQATAKLDLRLVPDMTAAGALAALKAHLAKRGFGDIEVNMTGGYDPTSTPADSALIRAEIAVYRRAGIDPIIWPRNAGSWPGYVFTGDPLHLAAGHFGLGHGSGAHAPNEYYVIESSNPKIEGIDGAARSHVEYLYELANIS